MKAMTKAHQIRRQAAAKFNCKVSEIHFGECLRLAHSAAKDMAQSKAIYDFVWGYKEKKIETNTFPATPPAPKRDDIIDLTGMTLKETTEAISSLEDKSLVVKITTDFITPEVAELVNLEGIVYSGTILWESRQSLKMIKTLKYVDCQNVGEEEAWDAEMELPGVKFK